MRKTKVQILMTHDLLVAEAVELVRGALVQSDISTIGARSVPNAERIKEMAKAVDCSSVEYDMHKCASRKPHPHDVLWTTIGSIEEEVNSLRVEQRRLKARMSMLQRYRKQCIKNAKKLMQVEKFINAEKQ
jgi:hypothetical protein